MQNGHALAAIAAGFAALTLSVPSLAQDHSGLVSYGALRAKPIEVIPHVGTIVIPESSIEHAGDIGVRAHTHSRVLIPAEAVEPPAVGTASNSVNPLLTTTETPASLACVYRLVTQTFGCNPSKVTRVATGGSRAIAIVDAYHNKTALNDLKAFSTHFGLPAPNLTVVYCSSTTCTGVNTPPPVDHRLGARDRARSRRRACHGAACQALSGGGAFELLHRPDARRRSCGGARGGRRRRSGDAIAGAAATSPARPPSTRISSRAKSCSSPRPATTRAEPTLQTSSTRRSRRMWLASVERPLSERTPRRSARNRRGSIQAAD